MRTFFIGFIASFLYVAVVPAHAAVDVSVKSDLTKVWVEVGEGEMLEMENGVAHWCGAKSMMDSGFVGFATHEAIKSVSAEIDTINVQAKKTGTRPSNTDGVYLVGRISTTTLEIIPVEHSPFGMGIRQTDGSVWHSGWIVISHDQKDRSAWVDGD